MNPFVTSPGCETATAIAFLTESLSLPDYGQDFDIELADANRLGTFLDFYELVQHDIAIQFALAKLIVASADDYLQDHVPDSNHIRRVSSLLQRDFAVHFTTIEYWAFSGDFDLAFDDGFRFSPIAHQVWKQYCPEIIRLVTERVNLDQIKRAAAIAFPDELVGAIFRAIEVHSVDVVEHLLSNGVDTNTADYSGRSPIHYAAGGNDDVKADLQILELLVAGGAAVNGQDELRWTPIHIAAMNGITTHVDFLLSNKADPTIIDTNGYAPLHSAVESGRLDVVELLVDTIPRSQQTKNRESVMDIAKRHKTDHGKHDFLQILQLLHRGRRH